MFLRCGAGGGDFALTGEGFVWQTKGLSSFFALLLRFRLRARGLFALTGEGFVWQTKRLSSFFALLLKFRLRASNFLPRAAKSNQKAPFSSASAEFREHRFAMPSFR